MQSDEGKGIEPEREPGLVRLLAPALLLAALSACHAAARNPAWTWMGALAGGAAGFLCWPPWRFRSRQRYAGTRWRVWLGLLLVLGLGGGQAFAAWRLWSNGYDLSRGVTVELLIAAATATCATAGIALFIAWLRGDAAWSLGL